jgi:hypothetical protein
MFEQAFKNIDDVLWKEAGCTTGPDCTEQTSWLLFLKYLNGLEQDKADEAALDGKKYTFILDKPYRSEEWAAPKGKDGQIDHIDELRFRSQTEKHELSHLYEAKIGNLGNAGRNGGEYYTPRPLNDADLAEFVTLQTTSADSPKSWSVDAKAIDPATFDLSVKNPNGGEAVAHRSAEDIMDEIAVLDAESAAVLETIRGLL